MRHILTLDIGGTNPRMAIVRKHSDAPHSYEIVAKRNIDKTAVSLIPQINDFLRDIHNEQGISTDTCCASVAGPVVNNACHSPTNAKFPVDGVQIMRETACKYTLVINDFAAIAHGVCVISHSQYKQITAINKVQSGNRAIIGPGTGLGVAYVPQVDGRYVVSASEGGNAPIGSYRPYQKIITHLCESFGSQQLDAEALLSGHGIETIAKYLLKNPKEVTAITAYLPALKMTANCKKTTFLTTAIKKKESIPEFVSHNASKDLICNVTLRVFFELLGSATQTVALHGFARGGVYIAGGIVPKNQELFVVGDFLKGFRNHHRESVRELLETMPIYLITDYDISFIGCAHAIAGNK